MQVIMELEEYQHLKAIEATHEILNTYRLQTWAGDIEYRFISKTTTPDSTLAKQFYDYIQEFQPQEP